jgi:putative ABC transport system permease protein
MSGWLQDIKVAFRSLDRSPGYAILVVLMMGLGIGVNTMVFNIANTFLFRPLPYIDANRTAVLYSTDTKQEFNELELSYPDLVDIRTRATSFESVVGYYETMAYMTLGTEPERFEATAVTSGFLRTFGTAPLMGRDFLPEEEEQSRAFGVIMISERIWRDRFGADPRVLGRTVKMNGRVRTIVGVAPKDFRFPETAEFFIPVPVDMADNKRDQRYLDVLGRIKPGVTVAAANAEFAALAGDLAQRYPETNAAIGGRVVTFRDTLVSDMGPILALLMSAVGFVLLIACANVANLMLARGAGRQREIALRFALGATRGRIVRQLLTESLLLSMMGGVLGLVLALWGRDLCLSSIPNELPYWMDFSMDPNTVAFMIGVSMLSAVLAGLLPALQTSQVNVHEMLKDGGHQGTAGRGRSRLRSALVVAELALAVILLTGAGLMIRSFVKMTDQRAAIRPEGVLTARLTMPIAVYTDEPSRLTFLDGLFPAIEGLPGVRFASATTDLPLDNSSSHHTVLLEQDTPGPDAPRRLLLAAAVRPRFFEALGIPMRSGRDFNAQDGATSAKVTIVSESAARKLWPDQDAIGRRIRFGTADSSAFHTVVGVAADVNQNVEQKDPPAQMYVPHSQWPVQTVTMVVKHDGDAAAMTTALRRLVQSRDADMPLYDVRTMEESLRNGLWESRIYVALMGVFAVLALVIAAVGIYGVMAYSVAQRTQEIGIRMALGAARADVLRLVVGQALRLTLIGMGIGLAGAYAVTRLMASLLFGVSASDPPTFVGVTLILALSALVAAWLPAERATRVDPMVALRSE